MLALLTACGDPTVQADGMCLVDLNSLIDGQVQRLDSSRLEVQKEIRINGQPENRTTSRIDWSKELAVFRELDICKPGLRGSYMLSQPAANVRLYNRKPGENTAVHWLKLTYDKDGRVATIEGVTGRSNYLYDSEKRLKLQLQASGTLAGYEIASRKKIIFGSEEHLVINSSLSER